MLKHVIKRIGPPPFKDEVLLPFCDMNLSTSVTCNFYGTLFDHHLTYVAVLEESDVKLTVVYSEP